MRGEAATQTHLNARRLVGDNLEQRVERCANWRAHVVPFQQSGSTRWPLAQFRAQRCTAQQASTQTHQSLPTSALRAPSVVADVWPGDPSVERGIPPGVPDGRGDESMDPTRRACFRRVGLVNSCHAGRASQTPGTPRSLCPWRGPGARLRRSLVVCAARRRSSQPKLFGHEGTLSCLLWAGWCVTRTLLMLSAAPTRRWRRRARVSRSVTTATTARKRTRSFGRCMHSTWMGTCRLPSCGPLLESSCRLARPAPFQDASSGWVYNTCRPPARRRLCGRASCLGQRRRLALYERCTPSIRLGGCRGPSFGPLLRRRCRPARRSR